MAPRRGRPWKRALPPFFLALIAWSFVWPGAGGPPPATHEVDIRGFTFSPARLEVAAGDTVVWINHDVVPHTATSGDAWDTGTLAAGASRRLVLDRVGEHPYDCTFHPNMKGILVVR